MDVQADMAGWGGTANLEVNFSITLLVGVPAMTAITNCEIRIVYDEKLDKTAQVLTVNGLSF